MVKYKIMPKVLVAAAKNLREIDTLLSAARTVRAEDIDPRYFEHVSHLEESRYRLAKAVTDMLAKPSVAHAIQRHLEVQVMFLKAGAKAPDA